MGQLNAWAQSVIIAGECGVRESTFFVKTYFPNQYIKNNILSYLSGGQNLPLLTEWWKATRIIFSSSLAPICCPFLFLPSWKWGWKKIKPFCMGRGGREEGENGKCNTLSSIKRVCCKFENFLCVHLEKKIFGEC